MVPAQHDGFERLLQLRCTSFQAQQLDKDLRKTVLNPTAFRGQRAAPSPYAGNFSRTAPQLFTSAAFAAGGSAVGGATTATPSLQASPRAAGFCRTICWQFRDLGACSRGEQCRFVHEARAECNQPAVGSTKEPLAEASAVPRSHEERTGSPPAANHSEERVEGPRLPEEGVSSPSTVRKGKLKAEEHIDEVLPGQEVQVLQDPVKVRHAHQSFMVQAAPSNRPQRSVPSGDTAAAVQSPRLAWQGGPVVGADGKRHIQLQAKRRASALSGSEMSVNLPEARSSAVAADSNSTIDAGVPRRYIRRPLPPVPRASKRRERIRNTVRPLDVQAESTRASQVMQRAQHRRMKEGLGQLKEEMTKLAVVFEEEAAEYDATVQGFSDTIHHLIELQSTPPGTPRLGWCTPSTSAGASVPASPVGSTRASSVGSAGWSI